MKLIESQSVPGDFYMYCPGCKHMHVINTKRLNARNASWSFNRDMELPTFNPSIKIFGDKDEVICHFFLHSGQLEYCLDSKHELSQQRVLLPEIPTDMIAQY